MPRIALWQPNLHAFGTPQDDFKYGSRMKDDIVQRTSGRSETGHLYLSSLGGGAAVFAGSVAPTAGSEVGVARLRYTVPTTAGANAAVAYGYIGGNAPWRLNTNYDYTFTAKVRCASVISGGATAIYEFIGMGVSPGTSSDFTSGIGFIRTPATGAPNLWRFQPICRDSGGDSTLANNESIILHNNDPAGGIYRSFMWRASHNGTAWTVTFYKLWDSQNTVGSAGEWINLGSITSNIPDTVYLGFFHQSLLRNTVIVPSTTCEYFVDYVTFEQRNKSVWRFT